MKKSIFYCAAAVLALAITAPSAYTRAQEEDHEKERAEHYHVQTPETIEAARALLEDKIKEIRVIIDQDGELDVIETEKIHEISYSLEAAVDKLREDPKAKGSIDSLDEAVQAMHHASENGETEKTLEWFEKLNAAGNISQDRDSAVPEYKAFYEIAIKDHKFTPSEIRVPAGKKLELRVHNQDPTPEEFESDDFRREKIIGGGQSATIFVGPLKPGKYRFFGEFNPDTANGYIIAE